jgi:hypothetical protein
VPLNVAAEVFELAEPVVACGAVGGTMVVVVVGDTWTAPLELELADEPAFEAPAPEELEPGVLDPAPPCELCVPTLAFGLEPVEAAALPLETCVAAPVFEPALVLAVDDDGVEAGMLVLVALLEPAAPPVPLPAPPSDPDPDPLPEPTPVAPAGPLPGPLPSAEEPLPVGLSWPATVVVELPYCGWSPSTSLASLAEIAPPDRSAVWLADCDEPPEPDPPDPAGLAPEPAKPPEPDPDPEPELEADEPPLDPELVEAPEPVPDPFVPAVLADEPAPADAPLLAGHISALSAASCDTALARSDSSVASCSWSVVTVC